MLFKVRCIFLSFQSHTCFNVDISVMVDSSPFIGFRYVRLRMDMLHVLLASIRPQACAQVRSSHNIDSQGLQQYTAGAIRVSG